MYFNYIFYWVVWHAIKYNFVQVIVITIIFLITFLNYILTLIETMCYEKTKIKICHKCFFHLHITCRIFPSTHYRPLQDEYHVSWVCVGGSNCLRVTTLRPRHITYITYMTPTQCWILYSCYTAPSSVCHSDSLFNVS